MPTTQPTVHDEWRLVRERQMFFLQRRLDLQRSRLENSELKARTISASARLIPPGTLRV